MFRKESESILDGEPDDDEPDKGNEKRAESEGGVFDASDESEKKVFHRGILAYSRLV